MEQSTLLQIAEEFGSPIYVYDAHKIEAQYKRLTNAFNGVQNLKVHYAAKALTNISVLKFVSNLGAALRYRIDSRSSVGTKSRVCS